MNITCSYCQVSICTGVPDFRMSQLSALKVKLYLLSIVGILIELSQLINQKHRYFLNPHSYLEVMLYIAVLVFIQVGDDDCWCTTRKLWQLGAIGCVLAWLNLVYILKRLPFTAIPINMMINILFTFFSVILLPILLILTFALPFYMLLSDPVRPLASYYHTVVHVFSVFVTSVHLI